MDLPPSAGTAPPAPMMAGRRTNERMVDYMTKLEQHTKMFLEVRDILQSMGEMFALARAYKKPYKWYGEHTTQEAVEILIAEANK